MKRSFLLENIQWVPFFWQKKLRKVYTSRRKYSIQAQLWFAQIQSSSYTNIKELGPTQICQWKVFGNIPLEIEKEIINEVIKEQKVYSSAKGWDCRSYFGIFILKYHWGYFNQENIHAKLGNQWNQCWHFLYPLIFEQDIRIFYFQSSQWN